MYTVLLLFFSIIALAIDASPTRVTNVGSRTVEKRATRTSNPGGCLEVQGTSPTSSQYKILASAVVALSLGITMKCIFIYFGIYKEQVTVKYGGALTIYGYTTR